jgi:hypothetical protein
VINKIKHRQKFGIYAVVIQLAIAMCLLSPIQQSSAQDIDQAVSGSTDFEIYVYFDRFANNWQGNVAILCLELDGEPAGAYVPSMRLLKPQSIGREFDYFPNDSLQVDNCSYDLTYLDMLSFVDFTFDTRNINDGKHKFTLKFESDSGETDQRILNFTVYNGQNPNLEFTSDRSTYGEKAVITGKYSSKSGNFSKIELSRGTSSKWVKGTAKNGKFSFTVAPFYKDETIFVRAKRGNKVVYLVGRWRVSYKIVSSFPRSMTPGQSVVVIFKVPGIAKARCRVRERGASDFWFNVYKQGSIRYTQGEVAGSGFVQCSWNNNSSYSTMNYFIPVKY